MKKLLLSITVFCYLAVSTGFVVNFHYCMNHLASVKLFATTTKVCDRCGMKMHKGKGCCHDEVKVVKLQTDHNKAQFIHSIQAPEIALAVPSVFIVADILTVDKTQHFLNHSPPLLSRQDTYLQNCVFRI